MQCPDHVLKLSPLLLVALEQDPTSSSSRSSSLTSTSAIPAFACALSTFFQIPYGFPQPALLVLIFSFLPGPSGPISLWVLWVLFFCFPLLVRSVPILGVFGFVRTAAAAAPSEVVDLVRFACLSKALSMYSFVRLWAASAFTVPFGSASILFRHSSVCAWRACSSKHSRVMYTLIGNGRCSSSLSNFNL